MIRICLDPGHGGRDPGAVGPSGLREKDVALEVCKKLAAYLCNVADVQLTRWEDRDLGASETSDLQGRVDIANQFGAALFVSVHCNSGNSAAHGIETYAYKPGGQGEQLARAVQGELVKALGLTDRGVKFANYYVLRKTNMPAILVELAFISNPQEERLLADPAFQDKCAAAIARGIGKVLGVQVIQEVLSMFKDVTTNHWAASSIERLANLGIIAGDGQGNFRPDAPITRAEVVALLDRVLKLLGR